MVSMQQGYLRQNGLEITSTKWRTILFCTLAEPSLYGEQVKRGEGVGLVLGPEATRAWRMGGEEWEPVSSRIVTAKLKTKGGRSPQCLFLVSVYTSTFRASDEEKDDFFADLSRVLDGFPANSTLVVVGDWNARVGSYLGDGQWSGVLGKHGWGRPMRQDSNFLPSVLKTT